MIQDREALNLRQEVDMSFSNEICPSCHHFWYEHQNGVCVHFDGSQCCVCGEKSPTSIETAI